MLEDLLTILNIIRKSWIRRFHRIASQTFRRVFNNIINFMIRPVLFESAFLDLVLELCLLSPAEVCELLGGLD